MKSEDQAHLAKLLEQTALIHWDELQVHFARGALIRVAEDINLVETAFSIVKNDTAAVSELQANHQIDGPTDADALLWAEQNPEFWALVIAPWVLIQGPVQSRG
ncbi:DUF2288 domain-containing protein [Allohahella marinimesophila]|uniref:DUF2288 domain-containing protein n=1 Tax=Allohahella marinimesophila TaxID=1054972 RepID=A0ABP7PKS4_9GAMM